MKKLPICDECGESDTMLTQVSNFNDIKFLCSDCHQSKYQAENSNKVLNYAEVNNVCEECKKKDENVKSNLIMFGFKVCNSCKTSKTIFPI
jgi:protein-arginine kinase activator protein McsA